MKYNVYTIHFIEQSGIAPKKQTITLSAVNRTEAVLLIKHDFKVKKIISVKCIEDNRATEQKLF